MYDGNGYIVLEDTAVTRRYTYDGGPIGGMYLYGIDDGTLTTQSLWHRASDTTTQGVTNGFYNVPLNLQANPSYEDVTFISRSTWTAHFESIIANQPDIIGQALADNNFRDTTRNLTLGTGILQHVAPLLKAMLLASTSTYDLPQAIRYADQEYTRFRNKFLRKLIDLNNNGTVLESDLPITWVTTALRQITRDKTSQFPFALSAIAGDQTSIPPTPTCLGIQPAAVPAMVIDSTYDPPLLMVLGHDGSLTPAYGLLRRLDVAVAQGTVVPLNPAGITVGQIVTGANIADGTSVARIDTTTIT